LVWLFGVFRPEDVENDFFEHLNHEFDLLDFKIRLGSKVISVKNTQKIIIPHPKNQQWTQQMLILFDLLPRDYLFHLPKLRKHHKEVPERMDYLLVESNHLDHLVHQDVCLFLLVAAEHELRIDVTQ
jgi:hypothetical protein